MIQNNYKKSIKNKDTTVKGRYFIKNGFYKLNLDRIDIDLD